MWRFSLCSTYCNISFNNISLSLYLDVTPNLGHTAISMFWCLCLVTYKIRQSLLFVRWFYRRARLLTNSLAVQSYMLENWRSTFENVTVNTKNYYNIFLLTSHNFMQQSPLLVGITYTWFLFTGCDWLFYMITRRCVATAGEVYSFRAPNPTLGFSRVSVLSLVC